MKLILTKLGPRTGVRDVTAFVRNGLKRRFPIPGLQAPKIEKCRIIKILDDDTGGEEYIATINVTPEKAALKAIQRLNRTQLRGRIVEVRQFRYRSSRNDPRRGRYPVAAEHDRRDADRRRPHLRFERVQAPARVEAMDNFRRTYGY